MILEGAAIIDVGAMSSRPGAAYLTPKEELARLMPTLTMLVKTFPDCIFSVDTVNSQTAEKAIEAGAHIINDISGGNADARMFEAIASMQVPYVLMHMQGTPADMQINPVYVDVTEDVMKWFIDKTTRLRKLYVHDVIIDPGFGFGKTTEHNYTLLRHLADFRIFEMPLMTGFSRKSMVCKVLGIKPADALNGTTVLHVLALQRGAKILRVHDVKEAVEAIKLVGFEKGDVLE